MNRMKVVAVALLDRHRASDHHRCSPECHGRRCTATAPYGGDTGKISVYDGSNDGDPGKAEYYRHDSAGTKRTLWNHSGPGTRVISGDGSAIIKFKACDENDGSRTTARLGRSVSADPGSARRAGRSSAGPAGRVLSHRGIRVPSRTGHRHGGTKV